MLLSGLHRQQASHPPSTESPFSDLRFYEHQSPNAFSAFDNGPKGFYTVFRTLFQRIHSQEEAAAAGSGNDADSKAAAVPPAPEFGNLESSDSEVKVFYRYWGSFQTVKDFAWLDLHDPQAGTGRNMRRLLEAENNKARKAGKVAFVREVRNLADWVKSQDKRVQKAKVGPAQYSTHSYLIPSMVASCCDCVLSMGIIETRNKQCLQYKCSTNAGKACTEEGKPGSSTCREIREGPQCKAASSRAV